MQMDSLKKCSKCGEDKMLSDFYKCSHMTSGILNECKECTKRISAESYRKSISTQEGRDKEKARSREKYYRLGYGKNNRSYDKCKESSRKYHDKYPEKAIAFRLCGRIKTPDGLEKHHWSYNLNDAKDVIFATRTNHKLAHRYMIYDQERMMYRKQDGELLDTRERHEDYIKFILERHGRIN